LFSLRLLSQTSGFPLLESYVHRLSGDWAVPWRGVIELTLIGAVVYLTLKFLEGTRGARLMRAVLAILFAFLLVALIAQVLGLDRILFLYPYFIGGVFLISLIVFQPELRRGLMRIGETISRRTATAESARLIEPIIQAVANLSRRKIGALIAIERHVPLGGVMETGVTMDAKVTRELIETIFWPGSALHDLGMIISQGRIAATGCEFPLAEPGAVERVIGSRHRAALGISLEADALIVVVSEETGRVSVAEGGKLRTNLSSDELRDLLMEGLLHRPALRPPATDGNKPGTQSPVTAADGEIPEASTGKKSNESKAKPEKSEKTEQLTGT